MPASADSEDYFMAHPMQTPPAIVPECPAAPYLGCQVPNRNTAPGTSYLALIHPGRQELDCSDSETSTPSYPLKGANIEIAYTRSGFILHKLRGRTHTSMPPLLISPQSLLRNGFPSHQSALKEGRHACGVYGNRYARARYILLLQGRCSQILIRPINIPPIA
jgi:hypothetical protein